MYLACRMKRTMAKTPSDEKPAGTKYRGCFSGQDDPRVRGDGPLRDGPDPVRAAGTLRPCTSTNGPGAAESGRSEHRVFCPRYPPPPILHLTFRRHWWHSQVAGAGAGAIRNHGGKSGYCGAGCQYRHGAALRLPPLRGGMTCSRNLSGAAFKRKNWE